MKNILVIFLVCFVIHSKAQKIDIQTVKQVAINAMYNHYKGLTKDQINIGEMIPVLALVQFNYIQ